jgi:hypothetical protein
MTPEHRTVKLIVGVFQILGVLMAGVAFSSRRRPR